MSGMLVLHGDNPSAELSVGPGNIQADIVDQTPTVHEQFNEFLHSEVGGLGMLFGHDPIEHYPAPLQTSPDPQIEAGTLGAMNASMSIAASQTPQPDPEQPQVVAAKPVGGFNLGESVKRQVIAARDRLNQIRQGQVNGRE